MFKSVCVHLKTAICNMCNYVDMVNVFVYLTTPSKHKGRAENLWMGNCCCAPYLCTVVVDDIQFCTMNRNKSSLVVTVTELSYTPCGFTNWCHTGHNFQRELVF